MLANLVANFNAKVFGSRKLATPIHLNRQERQGKRKPANHS
jgi:hypothetical protein